MVVSFMHRACVLVQLLIIREFDEQIGGTQQFAAALDDPRYEPFVEHTFEEMVRMRVYGILAGYADQNDHDVLRYDPVFKLITGRSLDDPDLASQPTLSRFENMINIPSLNRLQDVLIEQFIDSFDSPPLRITLDIDAFDDPTHGAQQLTFWHGYYDQYQYLVRTITCAENDLVLQACLLFGSSHVALGAADDVRFVVERLRAAFPGVQIHLRGDAGFGLPAMYEACEALDVLYTFGLGMNAVLIRNCQTLLEEALAAFDETGQEQRRFCGFWYRAGSWPACRWVVVKVEVNAQGSNRRAVVTNRAGAFVFFGAAYDDYTDRGESENRHKELKCGLEADRLSDHRFLANLFRLYLHLTAHNLLVRLRRAIADPPPSDPASAVPEEALEGEARRRFQNQRREHDPLGEGQPCTWRTRLIKVACRVTQSTRRVVVKLSGCWPYLSHYRQVGAQVVSLLGAATAGSG